MKPDRKHLGVRVQQWTIDAVRAVARKYQLTNGEALEKIDEICADYTSGTRLTYDGQQVVIWGATPTTLSTENGWLRSVLTINFSAYVRRS